MINKEVSNSFIFFGFIALILQVMSFLVTDRQVYSIFDLMISCAYLPIAGILFYLGWKYRR
jgi:uncharacterized membrane-anchored protein